MFPVLQGDVGPVGPTGPQGVKGEQGDKGEKVKTMQISSIFAFLHLLTMNVTIEQNTVRRAVLVLGFQDSEDQRERTVRG